MEARQTPHTAFGRKLRSELKRQEVSARELARRINPSDSEGQRRTVARWLSPLPKPASADPSPRSRRAAAAALGLPLDFFEEDDDAETPLSRETQTLLMEAFSRIVAEARS